MHLALNVAKMAKGEISCATMEETHLLIKKPHAEVREVKKQGVEFPRHRKAKAPMERHLAMVHENQTDGFLPCENSTAKNPQTCWQCERLGAPPLEPTPPPPGIPPVQAGENEGAQSSENEGVTPRYVHIRTSLPNA